MRHGNDRARSGGEDQRWIALYGLVMFVFAIKGFIALGIAMKMNGYPQNPPEFRWTPIALSLRQHGQWLLLVPMFWVIYAVVCCHVDRGLCSEWIAGALGGLLLALIPILFLYAAFNSYTRSFLISTRPRATSVNGGQSLESERGTATPSRPGENN